MRTVLFSSSLKWAIGLCLVALMIMVPTLVLAQAQTSVSINAGGPATGSFGADQYFSGGSTYTNTRTIDTSQITTNPPPAAIFSTERYGAMTYTIPNRSGAQTVTLYFAETYVTAAGQRLFNVSINGATVLSNFDIYAAAGGADRAIARTFDTTANSSGQVVIQFTAVTQNPKINAIAIAGAITPTTPPVTTPPPTTPPPTTPPPVNLASINSGGPATGSFVADQYFSGGSTYTNTRTIDLSQISTNPPPPAVFNTERYGAMTYTIPNYTPGSALTVMLYFAETYVTAAGQRLFNVTINGSTVLSNFDIFAAAGGLDRAIARSFSTTANASGQVVIQFTAVTQNPKINGITVASGGGGNTLTVTKNGTGSASGTVISAPAGINCGSTCSAVFPDDDIAVTLSYTLLPNTIFGGWGGACSGTAATCTVAMTQPRAVTATFTSTLGSFNLSVTKSGTGTGTVTSSPAGINCGSTCSAGFASGASVTLTATATSGSTFGGWSGACSGTGTCTVNMNTNQSVTATFNGGSTVGSPGCGKAPTLTSGTRTIQSAGQSRSFILRIPDGYDRNRPYRLIFGFHWNGGTANDVDSGGTSGYTWSYYGLREQANNSTIFVAPQGINNGWPNTGGRDLTFVDDMVRLIENDLCVDTTRLFAMGFSYGGGMSYEIACARANVFRAVAVYSGAQLSGCDGGNDPIAYIGFHGISDPVVSISSGRSLRDRFVRNNGCTPMNPPEPAAGTATHIVTSYSGCRAGYPVVWAAFSGAGHSPAPVDGSTSDSGGGDRTWTKAEAWKFFTQF